MLTKREVKELPKGYYTNMDLAALSRNHGKQSRKMTLPVDKTGLVIRDFIGHIGFGKPYSMVTMRLNRKMYKLFRNS